MKCKWGPTRAEEPGIELANGVVCSTVAYVVVSASVRVRVCGGVPRSTNGGVYAQEGQSGHMLGHVEPHAQLWLLPASNFVRTSTHPDVSL